MKIIVVVCAVHIVREPLQTEIRTIMVFYILRAYPLKIMVT